MRTALMFSGYTRGFKFVVDDLHRNLIKNFGSVDTYFYLVPTDEDIRTYFDATEVIYSEDEVHNSENLNSHFHTGIENHQKLNQSLMSQWYSVKSNYEMVRKSCVSYDYVFRIRPDIKIINPLYPEMLDFHKVNIPNWGESRGYHDRFAAGPQNLMEIYCNFFNSIKEPLDDTYPNLKEWVESINYLNTTHGFTLNSGNSEIKLMHYLVRNKVPVNLIDYRHNGVYKDGSYRGNW